MAIAARIQAMELAVVAVHEVADVNTIGHFARQDRSDLGQSVPPPAGRGHRESRVISDATECHFIGG